MKIENKKRVENDILRILVKNIQICQFGEYQKKCFLNPIQKD